jgi:hypothetical protein
MSERSVQFRFATSADVDDVVSLVESAYHGEASRAGWTTEADLLGGQRTDREEIADVIAEAKARLLLCQRNGQLVGCVLARLQGPSGVGKTHLAIGLGVAACSLMFGVSGWLRLPLPVV